MIFFKNLIEINLPFTLNLICRVLINLAKAYEHAFLFFRFFLIKLFNKKIIQYEIKKPPYKRRL